MPKLLLIQSSQYSSGDTLVKQKRLYLPGLVFSWLAAYVPDHWDVEINLEVIDDVDFNSDADIIGIGSMGHAIYRAFDIAKEFKKRNKIVFMGGYMASMVPEIALDYVDSVVIGDAEISFPKLLADFESKGCIDTIYDNPLENLEHLKLPRYELLAEKRIGNMLPVQAGRGCNHTCSFCSIACLYKGRHLMRPVEDVIRDIKKIKSLGFKRFFLIDDNIINSPEYLEELCRSIRPLKMKWATQCTMNLAKNKSLLKLVAGSGCEILSLGIESISQEGLNRLNKQWLRVDEHKKLIKAFNEAGIMISAEMMIGTDDDTVESIRATCEFILKAKLPLVRVYILTPIPATSLYDEMKKSGRLIHENYKNYTAAECVHHPENITPEDLTKMYEWMNRKIFSIRGIMLRTLLSSQIFRHPIISLIAFGVNLHYRSYVKRGETPLIV